MKIVIPMSGRGRRFVDVGYRDPKPLVRVQGKRIIEHVLDMFPGDHDFVFICSKDHLATTDMESVLRSLRPKSVILPIEPHSKGPVFAVSQAFDHIADGEDVMVSYCDYGMDWDFGGFRKRVEAEGFDAAVPSYTGFHPHLLRRQPYAGVLTDGKGRMTEIREKHSFTPDPMDSHHSAGAYYFRRGSDLKRYFKEAMERGMSLNGEYYASTVYELLLRDGLKVLVPEAEHFAQLGTPEDLEEFEAWAREARRSLGKDPGASDIPAEREHLVKTPPYAPADAERSLSYWKRFFDKRR